MSELFVGRWVPFAERMPPTFGSHIVRWRSCHGKRVEHHYAGLMVNCTSTIDNIACPVSAEWLDPLDLANDEATVERVADVIETWLAPKRCDTFKYALAKAALGAAVRGGK